MENQSRDIAKPELIHKLEGCTDEVNGAVVIPGKEKSFLNNFPHAI